MLFFSRARAFAGHKEGNKENEIATSIGSPIHNGHIVVTKVMYWKL